MKRVLEKALNMVLEGWDVMQWLDAREVGELDQTLADLLREFPALRRELHEDLAKLAKQEVDAAIAASGVGDSGGRVRQWQVAHVGSRGGYAAVRPAGGKEGAEIGPNGPGAVTNYLEGGHKIRGPGGGKGYRPRIRVSYVNGFHFYETARTSFEAKALRRAEGFAERLAERLGGGK